MQRKKNIIKFKHDWAKPKRERKKKLNAHVGKIRIQIGIKFCRNASQTKESTPNNAMILPPRRRSVYWKISTNSVLHSVYIFVQQTRTIYMKVNLSNEKKTKKTMRMMKRKEKKSELEWESVPS